MNIRVTIRLLPLLSAIVLLLSLSSCELFANFNDGMTEKDQVYSEVAAERGDRLRSKVILGVGVAAVLGVAAFRFFNPEGAWWMTRGWKFRDAEPSESSLIAIKIVSGVMMVVCGVLLFVVIIS